MQFAAVRPGGVWIVTDRLRRLKLVAIGGARASRRSCPSSRRWRPPVGRGLWLDSLSAIVTARTTRKFGACAKSCRCSARRLRNCMVALSEDSPFWPDLPPPSASRPASRHRFGNSSSPRSRRSGRIRLAVRLSPRCSPARGASTGDLTRAARRRTRSGARCARDYISARARPSRDRSGALPAAPGGARRHRSGRVAPSAQARSTRPPAEPLWARGEIIATARAVQISSATDDADGETAATRRAAPRAVHAYSPEIKFATSSPTTAGGADSGPPTPPRARADRATEHQWRRVRGRGPRSCAPTMAMARGRHSR